MPKREYRISVLFKMPRFGLSPLDGFLDMLRYDRALVESWSIDNDMVEVTLVRENVPFTVDRWRSMGINVAELQPRSL